MSEVDVEFPRKSQSRQLHKFGGSSLASPEGFRRVACILKTDSGALDIIVVSAAGKTTNGLIEWLSLLEKDSVLAHEALEKLRIYQKNLIENLIETNQKEDLICALFDDLNAMEKQAQASFDDPKRAWAQGFGEVWSARLLCALLNQMNMPAIKCDSRLFLRAERSAMPEVNCATSRPLLEKKLLQCNGHRMVITGFMAQNNQGETVLLGRNGSDYSATVIGTLAQVSCVTIWSDVPGIYSADPRIVSNASLLPRLRLDEAGELARLGASVLHTRTLQPVAESCINLDLRCSYDPSAGSTRIERVLACEPGAKIITSVENLSMLELVIPKASDFSATHLEIEHLLTRKQLQPLAASSTQDQGLVQLIYTSEMVNSVLYHLQNAGVKAEFRLSEGYSMIAAVGVDVTANCAHCHAFYQQLSGQPIEFICESKKKLSIAVILRKTNTHGLLANMHFALFPVTQCADLLSLSEA